MGNDIRECIDDHQSLRMASMISESLDMFHILAYCQWPQRVALASLCKDVHWKLGGHAFGTERTTGRDDWYYWRFLCGRLADEHWMYIPSPLPSSSGLEGSSDASLPPPGVAASWHELFLELFPQRLRFDNGETMLKIQGEPIPIKVATRFKAATRSDGDDETEEERTVVLPLHQKSQIVQDKYGCSRAEALRMIMQKCQMFQTAEDDGIKQFADDQNPDEHRPLESVSDVPAAIASSEDVDDEAEASDGTDVKQADMRSSILGVQEEQGKVLVVAPGVGLREFCFDRVFAEKSSQKDVYEHSARRLVMDFLNGHTASIICYGQTGSGKTFTMFGPSSHLQRTHGRISNGDGLLSEVCGIVPRAFVEVLQAVKAKRRLGAQVDLRVSYVEVFGSEVSDLLRSGRVVGQQRATDRVGHRYVLDGHVSFEIKTLSEAMELLECGERAKRAAATAMNERSTRAHSILVLQLAQTDAVSGFEVQSTLFMADLGGSERVSKSKADAGLKAPVLVVGGVEEQRVSWEEYYTRRQRLQETLQINRGLFALKKVIEAIRKKQQILIDGQPEEVDMVYVPYQDSKLTMILKGAIGGASRTLIFCNATMDPRHAVESCQTLRFGEQCGQVRQEKNQDTAASVQAALRRVQKDIEAVEAEIVRKERWETQLIRRTDVDTVAGAFGDQHGKIVREEFIPTSVLIGAEIERDELERLLQRKADLQGLGGISGKDYRTMLAREGEDGGRGQDFRTKCTFHSKTRAKDFEQEDVLASALRHVFRRSSLSSKIFGETESSRRKRSAPLHGNYFELARGLREKWEETTANGKETRSFGKAMLDTTQSWLALFKRQGPASRDDELSLLLSSFPHVQACAEGSTPSSSSAKGSLSSCARLSVADSVSGYTSG